jgi:hypothetical protein
MVKAIARAFRWRSMLETGTQAMAFWPSREMRAVRAIRLSIAAAVTTIEPLVSLAELGMVWR